MCPPPTSGKTSAVQHAASVVPGALASCWVPAAQALPAGVDELHAQVPSTLPPPASFALASLPFGKHPCSRTTQQACLCPQLCCPCFLSGSWSMAIQGPLQAALPAPHAKTTLPHARAQVLPRGAAGGGPAAPALARARVRGALRPGNPARQRPRRRLGARQLPCLHGCASGVSIYYKVGLLTARRPWRAYSGSNCHTMRSSRSLEAAPGHVVTHAGSGCRCGDSGCHWPFSAAMASG